MGEFKVILSDRAKKDLLILERSGDKASIKKVEHIIAELYIHPETGTGKPERLKFELTGYWFTPGDYSRIIIFCVHEGCAV